MRLNWSNRRGGYNDLPPSAGETALMQPVRHSDLERMELLLQAGAEPNASNACGQISLHLAGDGDAALKLLGAGAEINRPSQSGTTPLMMAVSAKKGRAPWLGQLLTPEQEVEVQAPGRPQPCCIHS